MGNNASKPLGYDRLSLALPSLHKNGLENESWFNSNTKVWADNSDRDQFIFAVLAVASRNGDLNLADHDFKLLFSRRQEKHGANTRYYKTHEDELIATLVLIKKGIIEAKIVPASGGKDQKSAFLAFRKDVETQLEKLLHNVSEDGGEDPTVSEGETSDCEAPDPCTAPAEAPPAYEIGQNTGSS